MTNPYVQFGTIVVLILGAFAILNLLGYTLNPPAFYDTLRIAPLLPLVFGGIVSVIPSDYQSKERRSRIYYFINSRSFKHFITFWSSVAVINGVCYLISLCDFRYKSLFTYFDFATLVASYICMAVTMILLGRLLIYSRD